jgi:hypothetical protein
MDSSDTTLTRDQATAFAQSWIAAWNAHDLDAILSHYEDGVRSTSRIAARLLGSADGLVAGKAALRAYFQRGLDAYPDLAFHLEDVFWSVASIVILFTNQKGARSAEYLELSPTGRVSRVVAHHDA